MATNDRSQAAALPHGLLAALRADAMPPVRPGELERVRQRLATAYVDEPEVIDAIACGLLQGSAVRVADS